MKRGRKSIRNIVSPLILEILSDNFPRSIHSLEKEISRRLNRTVSWNTVQKYLQELVEIGKVEVIQTPHSKSEEKQGLTVYTIKK